MYRMTWLMMRWRSLIPCMHIPFSKGTFLFFVIIRSFFRFTIWHLGFSVTPINMCVCHPDLRYESLVQNCLSGFEYYPTFTSQHVVLGQNVGICSDRPLVICWSKAPLPCSKYILFNPSVTCGIYESGSCKPPYVEVPGWLVNPPVKMCGTYDSGSWNQYHGELTMFPRTNAASAYWDIAL